MRSKGQKYSLCCLILILSFNFFSFSIQGQSVTLDDIRKLKSDGKFAMAIHSIDLELNANQTDSVYAELVYTLADIYLKIHEFDSAISRLNTLIKLNPNISIYYDMLSYAYWATGNRDSAIEYSKKAYKLDSTNVLALNNLSYYLSEAGNYEEAIYYANLGLNQKVNLKKENRALILNNRGLGYIGLNMYKEALKDINLSIKLNPNNSYAYFYRALANAGLGKLKTVCDDLAKSKELGGVNLTKEAIKKYCDE